MTLFARDFPVSALSPPSWEVPRPADREEKAGNLESQLSLHLGVQLWEGAHHSWGRSLSRRTMPSALHWLFPVTLMTAGKDQHLL